MSSVLLPQPLGRAPREIRRAAPRPRLARALVPDRHAWHRLTHALQAEISASALVSELSDFVCVTADASADLNQRARRERVSPVRRSAPSFNDIGEADDRP